MKLTHRLWTETPEFRRNRWIKFGLLAPVAAFAGGMWGSLSGSVGAIFGGAALFVAGAWLHTRIYPALLQWADRVRPGGARVAALLWDGLLVGGGGLLLTRGLGMPWSPSVGTSLVLGGGAALGFAAFFDDGGTRFFHTILSPMGRGEKLPPAFSHIEARLARRDYPAARVALETFIDENPRDERGWVSLARLLAGPMRIPDEALRVLQDGLNSARRQPALQEALVRQMVLVWKGRGEPLKAAPVLARYAEIWGDSERGEWARTSLAGMKDSLREDPEAP